MSVAARPEPASNTEGGVQHKTLSPDDYTIIQQRIRRVWDLIDEIEAETRQFKEESIRHTSTFKPN